MNTQIKTPQSIMEAFAERITKRLEQANWVYNGTSTDAFESVYMILMQESYKNENSLKGHTS